MKKTSASPSANPPNEKTSSRPLPIWKDRKSADRPEADANVDANPTARENVSSQDEVKSAIANLGDAPPPTNLDRALPPAERARERAARNPAPAVPPPAPESRHFVVALDRARLRIFSESHPTGQLSIGLQQVQAVDFPNGRQNYFERDSDQRGQFPGSSGTVAGARSTDERLATELEQERRLATTIADTLKSFFRAYPDSTWDLAAEARLQREVLERLDSSLRERLRQTVSKDLSKQPAGAILAYFAPNPTAQR